MPDIRLMILCDFFEIRYRRATKKGRFKMKMLIVAAKILYYN
jgi:hypothetical protein